MSHPYRGIAIVVGISNYVNVGKLEGAVNDANEMTKNLREHHFDVIDLINPSVDQIKNGVLKLNSRLSINSYSVVVVYYAGHGVADFNNHFILGPEYADEDHQLAINSLNIEKDIIGKICAISVPGHKKRSLLVILDTCRKKNIKSIDQFQINENHHGNEGTIAILVGYACGRGLGATDGYHGLYTQFILEEFFKPGVCVLDALSAVNIRVANEGSKSQKPQMVVNDVNCFKFCLNQPETLEELNIDVTRSELSSSSSNYSDTSSEEWIDSTAKNKTADEDVSSDNEPNLRTQFSAPEFSYSKHKNISSIWHENSMFKDVEQKWPRHVYTNWEDIQKENVNDMVPGPIDIDQLDIMILTQDLHRLGSTIALAYTNKLPKSKSARIEDNRWLHLGTINAAISCRRDSVNGQLLKDMIIEKLEKHSNGAISVHPHRLVNILVSGKQLVCARVLAKILIECGVYELRIFMFNMKMVLSSESIQFYNTLMHNHFTVMNHPQNRDPHRENWGRSTIDIGSNFFNETDKSEKTLSDIVLFRTKENMYTSPWGMCLGALPKVLDLTTGSVKFFFNKNQAKHTYGIEIKSELITACVYPLVMHNLKSFCRTKWNVPERVKECSKMYDIVRNYLKYVYDAGIVQKRIFGGFRVEVRLRTPTLCQALDIVHTQDLLNWKTLFKMANMSTKYAIARLPVLDYFSNIWRMCVAFEHSGFAVLQKNLKTTPELRQVLIDLFNACGMRKEWYYTKGVTIPEKNFLPWFINPKGGLIQPISLSPQMSYSPESIHSLKEETITEMERHITFYPAQRKKMQFIFKYLNVNGARVMSKYYDSRIKCYNDIWEKFGHSWKERVYCNDISCDFIALTTQSNKRELPNICEDAISPRKKVQIDFMPEFNDIVQQEIINRIEIFEMPKNPLRITFKYRNKRDYIVHGISGLTDIEVSKNVWAKFGPNWKNYVILKDEIESKTVGLPRKPKFIPATPFTPTLQKFQDENFEIEAQHTGNFFEDILNLKQPFAAIGKLHDSGNDHFKAVAGVNLKKKD